MDTGGISITFDNLSYNRGGKAILHSIDGQFKSGCFTGILGPSGAGKSTLLNILAGIIHEGVGGNIYINNEPRNNHLFKKQSCYIMQDVLVQPNLTVQESMEIASQLKLGTNITPERKQNMIGTILESMGLQTCCDTRTQYLSGGQRKRLAISLELLSNPPVMFLDEPTTGLDEVTLISCMKLLKSLTNQGRTIICTIHQPSDNVFELFDQVFFVSEGKCVYSGPTNQIVPFLKNIELDCPRTHSPADFLLENVAQNSEVTQLLAEETKRWRNEEKDRNLHVIDTGVVDHASMDTFEICQASFWVQVFILAKRRWTQTFRNKLTLSFEYFHHVFASICIGMLFYQKGNDANSLINNVFIFYSMTMYLIFTHGMVIILIFPLEIDLLRREYLNGWYNLKAYFLALNITIFPIACLGALTFSLIVYYLTGQPDDYIYRIVWFAVTSVLFAMASQGFGLIMGSIFQPKNGACIGSAVAIVLILLAVHGMGYGYELSSVMKGIMSLSYIYHGFTAYVVSVFRYRGEANCEDVFCYFTDPNRVLYMMGMDENGYLSAILYLIAFSVLHRIIAFYILKGRVTPDSKLYKYFQ